MRCVHPALFALSALLALGACTPIPTRIDFLNDRRVFRGPYEAEVDLRKADSTVALTEDAALLVMGSSSSGGTRTQLWDVAAASPIENALGNSTDTADVAITRDGSLVAAGFRWGVSLWNVSENRVRTRLPATSPACPDCGGGKLAFSADGGRLALHSGGGRPEGFVSVFDTVTGERLLTLPNPGGNFDGAEVRFSADGTRLALVSQAYEYAGDVPTAQLSRVALWSLPEGALLGNYLQNTGPAPQADAHAWNGRAPVIGVAQERSLELRDAVTGAVLGALPLERRGVVPQHLFLSPDGRLAVLGYTFEDRSGAGTVRGSELALWDLPSAKRLVSGATGLQPLGFTADSATLLTYSDEGVALRDPPTLAVRNLLVTGALTPLRVEAEPTPIDARHYALGGTVLFGEEPPTPLTGEATGGDTQLYVQMSPIETPGMSFEFSYQGEAWQFTGAPASERSFTWHGLLGPTSQRTAPYEVKLTPTVGP